MTQARVGLIILVIWFLLMILCNACTPIGPRGALAGPVASAGLPAGDPSYPMPAPDTCTMRHETSQVLPDPHCTPGALNPDVTQATIATTICAPGWTKTIRPPVAKTNTWKRESDLSYGLPTNTLGEYDHLISLELGGAPLDTRNLWIEPGKLPNPKDKVENALHAAVCSHRVTLAAAQQAIATDWTTAEASLSISANSAESGDGE